MRLDSVMAERELPILKASSTGPPHLPPFEWERQTHHHKYLSSLGPPAPPEGSHSATGASDVTTEDPTSGSSSVARLRGNGQYKRANDLCLACRTINIQELFSQDGYMYTSSFDALQGCKLCELLREMAPRKYRGNPPQADLQLLIRRSQTSMGTTRALLGLFDAENQTIPRFDISVGTLEADFEAIEAIKRFQIPTFQAIEDTSSSKTLAIIRGWYEHCTVHHDCGVPIFESAESVQHADVTVSYPTRLLDLCAFVGRLDVKLVENPTVRLPYATLSHCWGPPSDNMYRTTTANLSDRKERVLWTELPKTFRDAIVVCRYLHIRFLWIDSICIIQDSASDWKHESATMAEVYGNSSLTISADWSKGPNFGCFHAHPQPLLPSHKQSIQIQGPLSSRNSISLYFCPPKYSPNLEILEQTTLSGRAWAVQERLLSPRIVHFTKHQAFWECRECFAAEDLIPRKHTWPKPKFIRNIQIWHDKSLIVDMWYSWVLKKYTNTVLTMATDRLVAISAVARLFYRRLNFRYLAGLWDDGQNFLRALAWYRVVPEDENLRSLTYIAPSWSWASVNSHVLWSAKTATFNRNISVVEDVQVIHDNDPFGQVSSGEIRIRGPCVDVHTLRDLADSGKFPRASPRKVTIRLDYSSVEPPQFELIVLFSTSWLDTVFYLLLVAPSENRPCCYERRGLVEMEFGERGLDVATLVSHMKTLIVV